MRPRPEGVDEALDGQNEDEELLLVPLSEKFAGAPIGELNGRLYWNCGQLEFELEGRNEGRAAAAAANG